MLNKPSYDELEQRIHSLEQDQKALRETAYRYRGFVDDLPVLICGFLPGGEITFVNKTCCEYFGKPPVELVGANFLSLLPDTDQETVMDSISSLTASSPTQSKEHRVIAAGGETRWQRWTSRALFDAQGNVLAYRSYGEDITEHKRAEKALQCSEEKYRSLFENMSEGFALHEIITDEKGQPCDFRFLEMNPACERLTRLKREDVVGHRVREFAAESAWIERYGTVALTGQPERFQDYSTSLDQWFEVSAYQPRPGQCAAVFSDITERKRAEETLQESQRQLAALFSNLPGMAYRCLNKRDWPMEIISDGSCALTGYKPSELTGRDRLLYGDLIHPDDRRLVWDSVQQAIHVGEPFVIEYRIIDRQGEEHWVWERGRAVDENEEGTIIIEGFISDITERKRAEEELTNSKTHLRTLLRTIPDLIWLKDQDGVYLSCNSRFERFFGAEEEDIIGKTDYDFVGKELADSFRKHDKAAMDKGAPSINEEEVIFSDDGHHEILETIKTPMFRDDGQIVGVLGIGRDITHRKQAEESLHASHQRFLTVLNSIDAMIYVADIHTHEVLFMNRHMIETFGRDMTGERCWDVFRGKPAPCARCTNDQLIGEDGKPTAVYVWHDRNPITGRWYINHDRAIEWTDGRLVRIQIATDITDLRKMEEDLRQAHKMDALGTLAGGIAHDFNNILSAIIGYTELSMDEVEKGSVLEDNLNEVFNAGKRAKDLVNQILAFARQAEEDLKPIQVGLIAKEALKLIRSSTPTTIDIRSGIVSDSLILGNPTQVHQIIMNLCTNAAYAMEDEGGVLSVALEDVRIDGASDAAKMDLQPGNYMRLTVSDTGAGIPAAAIPSIFEPYFTTKPVGEGTGMGLAVVHGIVNSYGGRIEVESESGQGTVFTIHFPIARKRELSSPHEREVLPTGTEHILVVDDEAPIANLTGGMLKNLGYQVTTRTSSLEALELFKMKSGIYDLVITDMTMPSMTGDLLARELMKIQPDIPVVLCTGYSRRISDQSAKEIGIRAFAHKPFTKADLAKTVRRVLDEGDEPPQG